MPESSCSCNHETEVKEFSEFNSWVSKIIEGQLPNDVIDSLKKLVDDDIEVGENGSIGIKSMQGVGITDNDLNNLISDSAPSGKLNTALTIWLNRKGDTHALQDLGLSGTADKDAGTKMPAATEPEETPPEPEANATPPEAPAVPEPTTGAAPPPAETPPPAEDDDSNKKNSPKLEGSPKYLVKELIKGFFDGRKGTWTLGRPNIVTKVVKDFGEEMRKYAVGYIKHLSRKSKKKKLKKKESSIDTKAFEDILRLSGLKK